MSRRALAVATLLLMGCPYVPEGELRIEQGELPLVPGAAISFSLYCDGLFSGWELTAGPDRCGKDWELDGISGGNAQLGAVTSCGEYTAPAVLPPEAPLLVGSECLFGYECADGCSAGLYLELE